jgi:hypothetical protein
MAKRGKGGRICAEGPVKLAHLCELDLRTKIGSPAWEAVHTPKQQRLSALRGMHAVYGSHEAVQGLTDHASVKNMQTRTMVRLVQQGSTGQF